MRLHDYVTITWQPGDVQTLFDLTDDEAVEFLQRNGNLLRDRSVELGWGVLKTLGEMEGLSPLDD